MASDPQADRIRLVVEPEDGVSRVPEEGGERVRQHRPEDMIDLARLEDEPAYEFEDEFEDGDEDGEGTPGRRRLLPIGLAAIALAGFGAIAWYGYQGVIGGFGEEAIPLIQADAGPVKTRPAVPGGLDVPYRDKLVLNEIAPDPDKPQVGRLLPPPEVPKPPVVQDRQAGQAGQAPAADTAAPLGAPKAATPKPLAPAAGTPAPKVPAPKGVEPKSGQAAVPAKPKVAPEVPKVAAPRGSQSAAVAGGYLVQFASLRDKKLVAGEWARLRRAFPDLLAGKKLVPQAADLGSRGVFHRVRAGYFADRASAAALCRATTARNQACIVVKP